MSVSKEVRVQYESRHKPLIPRIHFFCLSLLDISQVQCIKSYQAQEHDELTLEKADILHAKTITSDGKSAKFSNSSAPKSTKAIGVKGGFKRAAVVLFEV